MGDGSAFGMEFRGQRIVNAMLEDLVAHRGLGKGSTVVFGGGSAGGRGAMTHLDAVSETLTGHGARKVVGFLDSPYYVDDAPYPPSGFVGFAQEMKAAYEHFDTSGVCSSECLQVFADAPWKCTFGEYRMPFLKTPYLMAASQFDGWQISNEVLGYNGIVADPTLDAGELAYVLELGNETRAQVSLLPGEAGAKKSSVFSIACYSHHVSEKIKFSTEVSMNQVSQSDALYWFLQDSIKTSLMYVDDCDGFNCGNCA